MASIYFDNNATTRLDPRVLEVMLPLLDAEFGNPSSMHGFSAAPQTAVKRARGQVRALMGAGHDDEIVFTSGGTEGVNAAIRSALEVSPGKTEIIVSAVEHLAVLALSTALARRGIRLHVIPVDADGRIDMAAYEAALSDRVAVVSIMWANNETGVIFPVAELAAKAKAAGALFHTDAVQAAGKLPMDVKSMQIDMLSISGHKLHAPKGIGALYVRRGVRFAPQILGGRQERGRRGGTENVPGIAALGKAAELAVHHLGDETTRACALRDRLESGLVARVPDCFVVGGDNERVANTSNVAFHGVEGEDIVLLLDKAGLAVSLGSACAAGSFEPSHVLQAMRVPETALRGGVRFSLSRDNTQEEVDRALEIIPGVLAKLRAMAAPNAGEAAAATLQRAHA
ncbi:MAG: cysteine desulfurase NifS [Hyphomicrobium sp.]|uniref:cysteine desulfurase NifS n=1 Tax=Hyphomicrobium sp. TaxID=82 RepID=UPI001325A70C|nr:cysteine desulfurase NifS [Hyphomicrobium sp.]KAB2943986.1 MAG: cysteine desulfurase NifS [Hyphomicrobium sp.]MBZ0208896.1 cysteine desulfurase NifS [Hyphomicrobium sp.]